MSSGKKLTAKTIGIEKIIAAEVVMVVHERITCGLESERLDFVFCRPSVAVVSSVGFDLKQIILIMNVQEAFWKSRGVQDTPYRHVIITHSNIAADYNT